MTLNISINNIIKFFIYIIAFFSTFRNSLIYIFGNQNSIMLGLDYLYLVLLLVTLFLIYMLHKFGEYKTNGSMKYVLFLLLWVILKSVVFYIASVEIDISRILMTSLLTTLVMVTGIKNTTQFYKTVWAAGIGFFISAFWPLMFYPELIGTRFEVYGGVAYSGGFWNYPLVSFVSIAWILLAITRMNESKTSHKVVAFTIFLIGWFASFAGLSRIFLIISVISALAFVLSSRGFQSILRFLLLLFLSIIIIQIMDPEIITRLSYRFDSLLSGNISDEARIGIWKGFLRNVDEYVLVGATTDYRTLGGPGWYGGTHSSLLNWFVQYGFLGLLGYLYLLFGLIKSILYHRKINQNIYSFLIAWFVGYLVLVLVNETGFYEPSFYTGFGLVLVWPHLISSQHQKK